MTIFSRYILHESTVRFVPWFLQDSDIYTCRVIFTEQNCLSLSLCYLTRICCLYVFLSYYAFPFLITECPVTTVIPSLQNGMSCRLLSSCTAVDCCLDVDIIGHSINAVLTLDPCDQRLTIGIENLMFNVSLYDFDWGKFSVYFKMLQINYLRVLSKVSLHIFTISL